MVSLLSEYEGVVRRHQHQDNINDIQKVFEKDTEICFWWDGDVMDMKCQSEIF